MSLFLYSFRRPLGVALLGFFTFAAPAVSQPVVPGQGGAGAAPAPAASDPSAPGTVCGQRIPEPAAQPPSNLGTILYQVAPCFDAQGNTTLVDIQTYLYYIKLRGSQPSQGNWISYNAATEQRIRDDFKELWGTNFLDNLWIEANDYTFANGVPGKIVVYHIEERQRVKNVDYVGSKLIERSKIEDKLKENDTGIRLDTFIDPALIRKVEGIVRDMMKEKGFQSADVTHEITPASGGPKLVNVTFHLSEGPKVKIQKVEFLGNTAINSNKLRGKLKNNRQHWWLSWITSRGTYQETKFDEDADSVLEYYRDNGYVRAQLGEPEVVTLSDSEDLRTRWVELRIPVTEGNRYRVNSFNVAGNKVVRTDALVPLFKVQKGDYYNQKDIRKGFEKAREIYGSGGYMEFTGYPDYKFSDDPNPAQPDVPAALAAVVETPAMKAPPTVDVTLQIQEGQQYRINRITFTGNTTTRDSVVRRELRLYEDDVFDTERLKYSIRRLNQLGYFKPLEGPGKDVSIDKTPNMDDKVDVKMKLEEQNRNQLTFGAGVSQVEGIFGQLGFQTSNFLGRGESLNLSLQGGSQAKNYTLAFTEPFLFDRNITGGANLFRSDLRYISAYTQQSTGGALTFGVPIGRGFMRMFTNYSYEQVQVTDINPLYTDPSALQRNPFLADALLLGQGGQRIISKITPSFVYNSVDQPIFPTTGKRLSLSMDYAGLGGNTKFLQPSIESAVFLKENAHMSLGLHGQVQYVRDLIDTPLPIFQRLYLGGEYSVRGFELRSIGPSDPVTGIVLGGNKSLLFNIEQSFTIASPVRLILFYDAGEVRDVGQRFSMKENIVSQVVDSTPRLLDPNALGGFVDPNPVVTEITGVRSAFKTSTGAEIRFFMPVLNVPFRLIFAYNPQRGGVLDSNFQQQSAFQFRFAVGTTF